MPGAAARIALPAIAPSPAMNGTDRGARLCQDGQRRGHVPQIDVQFDIGVRAAGRDIGQTERARAVQPRHGAGGNDAVGKRQ